MSAAKRQVILNARACCATNRFSRASAGRFHEVIMLVFNRSKARAQGLGQPEVTGAALPPPIKSGCQGAFGRLVARIGSVAAGLVICLGASVAHAQSDHVDACLSSHTEGQELRLQGKLLEARDELMQCSATGCPSQVIRDCLGWLEQIQVQIPSVGFRVTADGTSRADVTVEIDGKVVLERLSGKSIDLNPGPHQVRVLLPPFEPYEKDIVVSEGDKFRMLEIAFNTPASELPTPESTGPAVVEMHRPIPMTAWVFAGVSAAAAISGTAWGLSTQALKAELEAGCAPPKTGCSPESIAILKQRALIADISWGVSAVSLLTASAFYFLRPEKPVQENTIELDVSWLPDGGAVGSIRWSGM